jgi:hypothetical protein
MNPFRYNQTLNLQHDESLQQFRNARHVRNYSLVGLRSKNSLAFFAQFSAKNWVVVSLKIENFLAMSPLPCRADDFGMAQEANGRETERTTGNGLQNGVPPGRCA